MKYKLLIITLLLSIMLSGCVGKTDGAKGENPKNEGTSYMKISAEEAKKMMDSQTVTIVDVRSKEEFNEGHIPGAIILPVNTIGDKMPEELPDKDATLLIYCRSGNRSRTAALKLIELGYTAVYDFGGISDWSYDIEK